MEEKIYRARMYRIFLNLFWCAIGSCVVGWLSSVWLEPLYSYVIGGILFLCCTLVTFMEARTSIKISQDHLYIIKRGKLKHDFVISDCSFAAKTKTTTGITADTECKLVVINANGSKRTIDCDLIGKQRFYELLNDLGFCEGSSVKDLKTIRK